MPLACNHSNAELAPLRADAKRADAAPQKAPKSMNTGNSTYAVLTKSIPLTAGLEPKPIWTTVAARAVASNLGTTSSVDLGGLITSTAKNKPAMGALKPAATPAAQPVASNCNLRSRLALEAGQAVLPKSPKNAATFAPISTEGPSGPKEFPVPSVTAAKAVRPTNLLPLSIRLSPPGLSTALPGPSSTANVLTTGKVVPSSPEGPPKAA
mmetsp:Transcript_116841/g.371914  ORF Transcript_116841/g.371914 Transcript_116841/m.371914 type:complete len:210 (+) Transcript_116841:998-1627(+)